MIFLIYLNSNRAKCYMKLELYKTAIKDCDASLSLDKNYQIAYVIKGIYYSLICSFDDKI